MAYWFIFNFFGDSFSTSRNSVVGNKFKKVHKKTPDRFFETMWYFAKFRIAEFAIAIGIISFKAILEFLMT